MAVRPIYIRVDMELSGEGNGWTDVTRDVRQGTIRGQRGLRGRRPTDRIARTGLLTLSLINNETNSAGLTGYYSPGHASARAGFAKDIGIRATLVIRPDAFHEHDFIDPDFIESTEEFPLGTYKIKRIQPQSGRYALPRLTRIEARDYMDELATARLAACTVERGISEAEAAEKLIALVPNQPRGIEIGQGSDDFLYYGDLVREERSAPLTIAQQIAVSSFQTWWSKGDGTLVVETRNQNRAVFGSALTPDLQITESDLRVPLDFDDGSAGLLNKITGSITAREVGTAASVVARLPPGTEIGFPPGITTISLPFTDDDERSVRAGAIDLIDPMVENTDYDFNSLFDGSGTDESGNVTLSITGCGNAVEVEINNAAGFTVYPVTTGGSTLLQVRGTPISAKEKVYFNAETGDADRALTYDMPYQSDPATAAALVGWFKDTLSTQSKVPRRVPLWITADDSEAGINRAAEIAAAEISQIVTVDEPLTGLDGTQKYHLQAVDYEDRPDGHIWLFHQLAPAFAGPFVEQPSSTNARLLLLGGQTNQSKSVWVTETVRGAEADKLLVLGLTHGRDDATAPIDPDSVTGMGVTWVKMDSVVTNTGSQHTQSVSAWRAMGTPTDGKLTITFSTNIARLSYALMEYSEVDTSGTNGSGAVVQVDSVNAPGGNPTVNLSSFAGFENRPVLASSGRIAGATFTEESGYTRGGRRTGSSPLLVAWHDTEPDESVSMTSPGAGSIALEINRTNVAGNHLETDGSSVAGTVFNTGSVDPQDDALVLVGIISRDNSGSDPPAPTIAGNSLTYIQIATIVFDDDGGQRHRLTVFRGLGTASAGAITITFGASQAVCRWSVVQAAKVPTGGNGVNAVKQVVTGTAVDEDTVLAALGAFHSTRNRAFVFAAHEGPETMAEKSSWTRLGRSAAAASIISAMRYDAADQDASISTPGESGRAGAVAVEVIATDP